MDKNKDSGKVIRFYAIKDEKVGFMQPIVLEDHVQAMRLMERAANDEKLNICHFAKDFSIYFVGQFKTKEGKFINPKDPELVIDALSLKRKEALGLNF